jgi:hypothetical protein
MPGPDVDVGGAGVVRDVGLQVLKAVLDFAHEHVAFGFAQVDLGQRVFLVLLDGFVELHDGLVVLAGLAVDKAAEVEDEGWVFAALVLVRA